jgi:aquaporin Z
VVPYWVAQIAGAALAAGVVLFVNGMPEKAPTDIDVVKSLIVEFLYTFALAYVVLNVATAKANAGNSFYGLAIGFTVLAGAYSVGGISGGAFNPAVAVGITIMKLVAPAKIWIYFVANLAGGACAAFAFKAIHPGEE